MDNIGPATEVLSVEQYTEKLMTTPVTGWWIAAAQHLLQTGQMRLILGRKDNSVYLARFYLDGMQGGKRRVFLHNILRRDTDPAVHNHPYAGGFTTQILEGGYFEQVPSEGYLRSQPNPKLYGPRPEYLETMVRSPLDIVRHGENSIHRISEVFPRTWTLVTTHGPNARTWGFFPAEGVWQPWWEFLNLPKPADAHED